MVDLSRARLGALDPVMLSSDAVRRVVTIGWVLSIAIDRMSFIDMSSTALGALSLLLALAAVLRADQRWTIAAIAADEVLLLALMPELGNHVVLRIVVNAFLLIWFLRLRWSALPALRAMVVTLYLVAAVHKLNRSFLDPAVSCAGVISAKTLGQFGIDGSSTPIATASIMLTFAFEVGIPIALLFRRTRPWALLLGTAFHAGLALTPISGVASFSGFMFAAYLAFASPRLLVSLDTALEAGRAFAARIPSALLAVGAIAAVGAFWLVANGAPGALLLLVRPTGLLLGLIIIWAMWQHREIPTPTFAPAFADPAKRSMRAVVGVTLMMVFIVGSAVVPYLGGRTHAAFSMFGNLRTESEPNHLFIHLPRVFGYQDDLVAIESISSHADQLPVGEDVVIPGYEVGRLLAKNDDAGTIVFRDADGRHELDFAEARRRFSEPNAVEAFLFRMRPTDETGRASCRH